MRHHLSIAVSAMLIFAASNAVAEVNIERKGPCAYQCIDPAGILTTTCHDTEHVAKELCLNRSIASGTPTTPGRKFEVHPGAYWETQWMGLKDAQEPAPDPDPDPEPEPEPDPEPEPEPEPDPEPTPPADITGFGFASVTADGLASISWLPSAGADTYHLFVGTAEAGQAVPGNLVYSEHFDSSTTSVAAIAGIAPGEWYTRVCPKAGELQGGCSERLFFTVAAPEPEPEPDPDPEPEPDGSIATLDVDATGTPETVPAPFAAAANRPRGRIEFTVKPDAITTGSQHFLRGPEWGVWFYQNRLHGHHHTPAGERKLWRNDQLGTQLPLEGAEVIAGQALSFTVSWDDTGMAVIVAGQLRLYLEGTFKPPADLVYGANPNGTNPFGGQLIAKVYEDPATFGKCDNMQAWATVEGTAAPVPSDCLASLTISWIEPTTRTDGSPLEPEEIGLYQIFEDGNLAQSVVAPATQTVFRRVPGSTHCYRAKTKLTAAAGGLESDLSNEACKTVE